MFVIAHPSRPAHVRPHARAGVEIFLLRAPPHVISFALMRGRELKYWKYTADEGQNGFALMRGRELKYARVGVG